MAAIINIDTSDFDTAIDEVKSLIENTDVWMRPIAVELAGEMHDRIHRRGLASDGNPIGSYSSSYLNFRLKNKLGGDSKIILVQTRKLQNSWGAFPTSNGWGVGFVDDAATDGVTSLKKIQFTEQRTGKKITDPTKEENDFIQQRFNEIINQLLQAYGRRA